MSVRSGYGKAFCDRVCARCIARNIASQPTRTAASWSPNQAWTTDITSLKTDEGWLYLAAIVDLGPRRIVRLGHERADKRKAGLRCVADGVLASPPDTRIADALRSRHASDVCRELLQQFNMRQLLSRKGNCWDNAPMESFFKTLKVGRAHRLQYTSRDQARLAIVNWIEGFYNARRLHSAIGSRSPADFGRSLIAA